MQTNFSACVVVNYWMTVREQGKDGRKLKRRDDVKIWMLLELALLLGIVKYERAWLIMGKG